MRAKNGSLSPHAQTVLRLLKKSQTPLSAYEILDRLRNAGIKAPPTVYRALDSLVARGLAHRIESLNAFVACHSDEHGDAQAHASQFAICRACGTVTEIDDPRLSDIVRELGRRLKFRAERETLEVLGVCRACDKKGAGA